MKNVISLLFIFCCAYSNAQPTPTLFVKDALKANRAQLYNNIVHRSIINNLSYKLDADTEDYWQDAFEAMELIGYKPSWANTKIQLAFSTIEERSIDFQRTLLELVYANYSKSFIKSIKQLMNVTHNAKVFAMCAEYLYRSDKTIFSTVDLHKKAVPLIKDKKDEAVIEQLLYHLTNKKQNRVTRIQDIINTQFLNTHIVLFSFQRKNRSYPGLCIVRDAAGNFVTDEKGNLFSVAQLARSMSNMPSYLTNGNTPQGIFKMVGFDISSSTFIGPTENIQLQMPFETSVANFLNDSTITAEWNEDYYKQLLPDSWKAYRPLYESYYAGKAGRTEIIAHGTTVDPQYYKGQPFYPHTPTEGCLSTKEIWSGIDGKRIESNQQKLVDALKKVGGANGYCIVVEIDDQQKPVSLAEILPYLNAFQK